MERIDKSQQSRPLIGQTFERHMVLRNAISLHHFLPPVSSAAMHPITLSSSSPLFPLITTIIIIFISVNITTSSSSPANETTSSNCTTTFTCGSVRDLTYPFTGGDRPSHCGPPEFQLSCGNDYPELTIDSLTYRVLRVDQTQQTLTIARLDLWNNTCPSEFINSTRDLPPFDYGVDNEALHLIYDCSPLPIKPYNHFTCNVTGSGGVTSNYTDAYFLTGPIPWDPVLKVITCGVIVSVPILKASAVKLTGNETSVGEVLTEGFNVNYSLPYGSECAACVNSGGQCGYDSDSRKFACYCGNFICPITGNKSSSTTPLIIGLAAAGSAIAIGFGFLVFFRAKQRKHKIAALSKSKSLPTPPSSNGLPTPTTNFSRTTPSYPSSLSTDLEKGYFGVQVFTYNELEEATDNFDPARELGEGGFGVVYYGKLRDGRVVAVKRLYENNLKRVEQFINEIAILARLRHQNLVTLYGCTSRRSQGLLLVYEYIPNGTVADHLHGNRTNSGLLTWSVRLSIAIETASALTYLHKSDIIHRDVKTNNILLDNDFRVKVADFGLVRLFPTDVTHVSTAPQGTPGYVDPEYYQCYQLTDKSDVYSFGVVLVELISSLPAVDTNRHRHDINLSNMAINKIQNHTLHELVDPCLGFETDAAVRRMTTLVAELAFRCLQQDRDMRPTMEEVLESLRIIENEELNSMKAESLDVPADDVGLLKNMPLPLSPDSVVSYNWANSTAASTF